MLFCFLKPGRYDMQAMRISLMKTLKQWKIRILYVFYTIHLEFAENKDNNY